MQSMSWGEAKRNVAPRDYTTRQKLVKISRCIADHEPSSRPLPCTMALHVPENGFMGLGCVSGVALCNMSIGGGGRPEHARYSMNRSPAHTGCSRFGFGRCSVSPAPASVAGLVFEVPPRSAGPNRGLENWRRWQRRRQKHRRLPRYAVGFPRPGPRAAKRGRRQTAIAQSRAPHYDVFRGREPSVEAKTLKHQQTSLARLVAVGNSAPLAAGTSAARPWWP